MNANYENRCIANDVEAVVTSYNQGAMLLEAVRSLFCQTLLPAKIILVDDGSTDKKSIDILDQIVSDTDAPVPLTVIKQENGGVSSARNVGIQHAQAPLVLILDGDDMLEPAYIEQVSRLLREDAAMVAASSWMRTFGVLAATVCPCGGDIAAFLPRNGCPATHILRRNAWEQCGGYDEAMRTGFEDWDFFLSLLETDQKANIGIVRQPLLRYRTAPDSSNIKSMNRRLELMRYIMEKHSAAYRAHMIQVLLQMEATSAARLRGWECEILHTIAASGTCSKASEDFLNAPSYGDGGMAAAVRIASARNAVTNQQGG